MVDSQVRPNKVTDPRMLGAMRRIPRERFVPPAQAPLAYADEDVPLPGGRVPDGADGDRPAGPARRPRCGRAGAGGRRGHRLRRRSASPPAVPRVVALEADEAGLQLARAALADPALADIASRIGFVAGDLAAGWPAESPYDIVVIEGAFEVLPPRSSASSAWAAAGWWACGRRAGGSGRRCAASGSMPARR